MEKPQGHAQRAEMIEPDYTVEDAQNVMKQFVPCPYEAWQTLFDGPTGKSRDALYRCGAPAGQRVRLAAHCGAGPHTGDHRFLGRHRQHPSAAHQGPVQPGPRGLPCHGIHLRGPQPRPETGLYRRFERRAAIDVRQGRQCRHPQLCRGPYAGAFVFYPPDQAEAVSRP